MKENLWAFVAFFMLFVTAVVNPPPVNSEEVTPEWTDDRRLTEVDDSSSLKARIVKDSENNLHVVFNDYRHGPPELYYMKVDEEGNILVSEKPITVLDQASSDLGGAAVDSNDNVHIVWSDIRDNGPIKNIEIYYEKLDKMGNTLVDERRITVAPYYSLYPSIAVDSSDNLHIAWAEEMDINVLQEEIFYTKLDNNGNTLVEDTALTEADGNESLFPDIAVDSLGEVHIVWLDDRNETGTTKCQNYYYTKLNSNGETIVDDTMIFRDGDHTQPSIAVDSNDMIQMICSNRWFSATNEKKHVHYMKLNNIGEPVISKQRLTFTDHNASYPMIDLDSQGDIHVVWEDERHGDTEIYYMKLDDVGNILHEEFRLTENSSKSQRPAITMDRNDTINVVWADGRDYTDGDRVELYYKYGQVIKENEPPTVAIISPSEGQEVSDDVAIQGFADDTDGTVQAVKIKIDEDEWIEAEGTFSWSWTWYTTEADNGQHTIYAMSFDGTDYSNQQMRNITVNNIPPNNPPTVSITPPDDDKISGAITIQGHASDSDGSVKKVEVKIDNRGWNTASGTTSWSQPWDTTQEDDGIHVIYARAEDNDGERSSLKSIAVTVDNSKNTPPEAEILSPTGGTVSGIVEFSGTAADPEGDETIEFVQIRIGDEEWENVSGNTEWSYTWDTTDFADGEYEIFVKAYDGIEYSLIQSVIVEVDNPHEPSLTVTSEVPEKASGTLKIQGTASDIDGEIVSIEIQIDDGEWEEFAVSEYWSYDLDTTELSNGEHTIKIRVTDDEGESNIESFTIKVDNPEDSSLWISIIGLLIITIIIIIIAWSIKRKSR
jgi:hypothetical protein